MIDTQTGNRIIAGRYEIITEWDRGGMSIVYLARDRKLKKNWAVKEILKEQAINGKQVSNDLLTEAQLIASEDHRHRRSERHLLHHHGLCGGR